ncbi:MAG: hypothetical protein ACE5GE_12775 [Phycisphaerae bacterium]
MNPPHPPILALTALILAYCPAATAQVSPAAGLDGSAERVSLNFPGGPLADYIETVKRAAKTANIITAGPDAPEVPMPAVQFDAAPLGTALQLVEGEYALDERTLVKVRVETLGPSKQSAKPVYRVVIVREQARVWNVLDLFGEKVKPDDLLTAVETAVELLVENDRVAQVRFHEATGVLIATGTPRQVAAIGKVIEETRGHLYLTEMWEGLEQAVAAPPSLEKQLAMIQAQIDEIKAKLEKVEIQASPGPQG